ncbi:hypothetical protein [Vibrio sp. 10N.261.51.F12]|uniref:hypothetical protein n=1 Tax=Vibrio sp. 10N.261.51.F12 TaxID=3229679 RepID=UPI003551A7DA
MYAIVKVQAQVKIGHSGLMLDIPILMTEQGVFDPLLEYIVSQSHIKNLPWMNPQWLCITKANITYFDSFYLNEYFMPLPWQFR